MGRSGGGRAGGHPSVPNPEKSAAGGRHAPEPVAGLLTVPLAFIGPWAWELGWLVGWDEGSDEGWTIMSGWLINKNKRGHTFGVEQYSYLFGWLGAGLA